VLLRVKRNVILLTKVLDLGHFNVFVHFVYADESRREGKLEIFLYRVGLIPDTKTARW
jgi:hypothetical protein